jgi:hypothetical protein
MMALDLAGQRFGRLLALERSPSADGRSMWLCRCDCGQQKVVRGTHLARGLIRSCNCLNTDLKKARQTKHGDTPWQQPRAAEYRIWRHIKSRCLNPNVPHYDRYGGAGITICAAWRDDYAAFLRDMGRRPSAKHSIDRIDNARGYEPGNCRWATPEQQSRNRRCVKLNEAKATDIRAAVAAGASRKSQQLAHNVSKGTIGLLLRGKIWKENTL